MDSDFGKEVFKPKVILPDWHILLFLIAFCLMSLFVLFTSGDIRRDSPFFWLLSVGIISGLLILVFTVFCFFREKENPMVIFENGIWVRGRKILWKDLVRKQLVWRRVNDSISLQISNGLVPVRSYFYKDRPRIIPTIIERLDHYYEHSE